jgi:hypothetical protein
MGTVLGKFQTAVEGSSEEPQLSGYIPLIRHEMGVKRFNITELSRRVEVSKDFLSRVLREHRPLRYPLKERLFEELQIDRHKAFIAVELIQDWQAYHTNIMDFIANLAGALYDSIYTARNGDINALEVRSVRQAADFISTRIVAIDDRILRARADIQFGDRL